MKHTLLSIFPVTAGIAYLPNPNMPAPIGRRSKRIALLTSLALVSISASFTFAAPAALAAAGSSGDSLPVGSHPTEETPPPVTLTLAQARAADAAAYAADFGVGQAEALRRLAEQRSLNDALARLEASYPDRFAGGWIEHEPAFRGIARFKGAVPAGAAELAGDLVLRPGAPRSLAQLEARSGEVFDAVGESFDATLATTFDVKSSTIELSIQKPAELKDASEAELRGLLPATAKAPDVRVTFSDAPVHGNEHHYGGALTSGADGCTTGFTIFEVGTDTTGVLTAGHCDSRSGGNPSRWYIPPDGSPWSNMSWQDGHRGAWGDFEWHTATGHDEFDDFYVGNTTLRDVGGYVSSIYEGSYFCKYGRTTSFGCDNVYRTSVSITDEDGFDIERLVATEDHITDGGDSGGPWFSNNDAVGIHHGYYTSWFEERSLFSRIVYADNALPGIGLLTDS